MKPICIEKQLKEAKNLLSEGLLEQADTLAKDILFWNLDNVDALMIRATCHVAWQNFDRAAIYLCQAGESSSRPDLYEAAAENYIRLGKVQEAIFVLRKASELSADSGNLKEVKRIEKVRKRLGD